MAVLHHLQPQRVFDFFEQICAIAHGSTQTKALSDWCVAFAKARGLEYTQDAANNVIIIGQATAGYEQAETIILQGHLDMVCEKTAECTKDMAVDGLDLAIDEDYIYAQGTTLGGDDGIAIAMALAILDDDSIAHPRLEVLFTTDEEIGMLGADAMDLSGLRGRKLINIDSEQEGILTVSCAGGNTTRCTVPICRTAFDGDVLEITVDGLQGGHSGVEIDKGRANANVLCARVLREMSQSTQLRLVHIAGGLKDNAIAVKATAQVVVADATQATHVVQQMQQVLQNELRATDAQVQLSVNTVQMRDVPMDQTSTQAVICMLLCAPNGIITMSAEIAGLVQTSLNLGILQTQATQVSASYCVRSAMQSEKHWLVEKLTCLTQQLGGSVEIMGDYPGWEYKADSALRECMVQVFQEQYGHVPKIEAIHAGLECGLFCGKIPDLDCISIGPNMFDIHTPRERLSISSTQRVWKYLLEVLKRFH